MANIICPGCGSEWPETSKFCTRCGASLAGVAPAAQQAAPTGSAPVNLAYNTQSAPAYTAPAAPEKKAAAKAPGKAPLIIAIVVAVLALAALAYVLFVGNTIRKYEGSGYSSPEAAIEAYANALKDNDLDKMVSAFAIESFNKNLDLDAYIDRTGVYIPYNMAIPEKNELEKKINIEQRRSSILTGIWTQMSYIISPEYADVGDLNVPIPMKNYGSANELFAELFPNNSSNIFSSIKIGKTMDVKGVAKYLDDDSLADQYYSTGFQKSFQKTYDCFNPDDYQSIAIELEINHKDFLLFANAVQYSGKWYLYQFHGYLGNITGLSQLTGGLVNLEMLD